MRPRGIVTFAMFKLFGVVLTLAGIAGFILSVGMAVDANVLIFARMKEELRGGRTLRAILDRNLLSTILVCRAVAPRMMQRRAGHIVTISSVDALHGTANSALYATAKAGMTEYSRCLAVQLREFNVRVKLVEPGTGRS